MDLSVLQILQMHGMRDGGRGWEALGATSQLSVTLAAVNSQLRQRRHNELQMQACYAGAAAVLDQIRENVASEHNLRLKMTAQARESRRVEDQARRAAEDLCRMEAKLRAFKEAQQQEAQQQQQQQQPLQHEEEKGEGADSTREVSLCARTDRALAEGAAQVTDEGLALALAILAVSKTEGDTELFEALCRRAMQDPQSRIGDLPSVVRERILPQCLQQESVLAAYVPSRQQQQRVGVRGRRESSAREVKDFRAFGGQYGLSLAHTTPERREQLQLKDGEVHYISVDFDSESCWVVAGDDGSFPWSVDKEPPGTFYVKKNVLNLLMAQLAGRELTGAAAFSPCDYNGECLKAEEAATTLTFEYKSCSIAPNRMWTRLEVRSFRGVHKMEELCTDPLLAAELSASRIWPAHALSTKERNGKGQNVHFSAVFLTHSFSRKANTNGLFVMTESDGGDSSSTSIVTDAISGKSFQALEFRSRLEVWAATSRRRRLHVGNVHNLVTAASQKLKWEEQWDASQFVDHIKTQLARGYSDQRQRSPLLTELRLPETLLSATLLQRFTNVALAFAVGATAIQNDHGIHVSKARRSEVIQRIIERASAPGARHSQQCVSAVCLTAATLSGAGERPVASTEANKPAKRAKMA